MLKIDLKGKKAFIAGVGDDQGYGWAIAKALAEAGATILIGTWTPILNIFNHSLKAGRFDTSRRLSNGTLMEFGGVYPLDASFCEMGQVPPDIRENKRYKEMAGYTVSEVAKAVEKEHGKIDILVHSLANAPEVKKPLLQTSRSGYLAAMSASAYSFISLLSHFGPLMNEGGSTLSLTYRAAEKAIPGYGGGMSSAKAALESDTRTLAWEAGRLWKLRVNTISAGGLRSRAAKAIGSDNSVSFIDQMIDYSEANAPLQEHLEASHVGGVAAFMLSPLATAITGEVLHVDFGMNAMGVAVEKSLK